MLPLAFAFLLLTFSSAAAQSLIDFTPEEIRRIARHGPWPPPIVADPSNRVSGQAAAIELGRALFFEARLSPDGAFSCASCHEPARGWSDGRDRARGRERLARNTPGLLDLRFQRWFGWDGGQDSLWAQSLRPILDPREMNGSVAGIAALLRGPDHERCHARAFGRAAAAIEDEAVAIDAAKALAAFQETLVSARSPFDEFRDALQRGDRAAAARYPIAAQRGAKLFIGKGNCAFCHLGPAFTNGEFHDVGIRFFVEGGVDGGRHEGIKRLRESPFTLLGRWNDDSVRAPGMATRHVEPQHRNFGEFRVPGLRGAALTAPYMHNGSLATLRDVVRHYSEIDEDRLHADGEAILKPLKLEPGEIDDLVAFLESLTPAAMPAIDTTPTCRATGG